MRTVRHTLVTILLIALCPIAAGNQDCSAAEAANRLEEWFAVYAKDQRIGRGFQLTTAVNQDGKEFLERTSEERLAIRRGEDTVEINVKLRSRLDARGQLVEVEYELPFGAAVRHVIARPQGKTLVLREWSTGQVLKQLPWSPETGGPFADAVSVLERPLRPGERRSLRLFVPALEDLADVELVATKWEPTQLLQGTFRLLRIESRMRFSGGAEIRATWWTDRQGRLHKLEQAAGVVVTSYRTKRAIAESAFDPARLDLFAASLIPLDRPLSSPHTAREIEFAVELPAGKSIRGLFVNDARQTFTCEAQNRAHLITRPSPSNDEPLASATAEDRPAAADSAPSSFVEADAPEVLAAARKVTVSDDDPRTLAVALERFVHETVREKSYGKVFSSALEVLRSREGDCTEHAVLLAALCRARGLPARGAVGLVYSPQHAGLAYHMWTEVWIGEGWIPLDATLGRGRVGPSHLKIGHSHLEGPTSMANMLVFLQAAEGLRIRVVRVEETP